MAGGTHSGKVALGYRTARFRLVPALRSEPHVATPAVRPRGSVWTGLPAQKLAAPATVLRMPREHDERTAEAAATATLEPAA